MANKRKLTEKQKKFCDYYIETGNATEAARRAGYSPRTVSEIGYENLNKPHLKAYIDKRLAELESQRIADAKEVLQYLTAVLRGEVDEEVVVVESTGDFMSRARTLRKETGVRDRNKAAELLAKRYGLLTERINLAGDVAIQIVDDIEAEDDADEED